MSVGNLKDNGNRGNNVSYQLAVLELLGQIAIGASGCCPTAATEATLSQVLTAVQQNKDFEQNMVVDKGGVGCPGNCPVYLEIRIWNGTGFTPPIYYNAAGAVVTPVGPLEYVNNSFVLNNILLQLTAINADLDVALSTRSSEATQLNVLAALTAINSNFGLLATEATLLAVKGDTANLDVALSTRATEATLALVKANTDNLDVFLSTRASEFTLSALNTWIQANAAKDSSLATLLTTAAFQARINTLGQKTMANSTPVVIASDQSSIPVTATPNTIARTPSIVAVPANTALTNTVAGRQEVSIRVSGNNGQIGGVAVPNGYIVTFRADKGDTVNSVSYQTGAGTTMIITYLT